MASSMNKVILIGNLGVEPDLKYTDGSNKAVLNFTLATSERRKDSDGEWQDAVEWHNVVVWNNKAEYVAKYANKGDKLLVEGKLTTRSWEDENGVRKYKTEVLAFDVGILSSKQSEDSQNTENNNNNNTTSGTENDIPF